MQLNKTRNLVDKIEHIITALENASDNRAKEVIKRMSPTILNGLAAAAKYDLTKAAMTPEELGLANIEVTIKEAQEELEKFTSVKTDDKEKK